MAREFEEEEEEVQEEKEEEKEADDGRIGEGLLARTFVRSFASLLLQFVPVCLHLYHMSGGFSNITLKYVGSSHHRGGKVHQTGPQLADRSNPKSPHVVTNPRTTRKHTRCYHAG